MTGQEGFQRIGFIGAGNVACKLADALLERSVEVVALLNKDVARKNILPPRLSGLLTQDVSELSRKNAQLIIIAVGDNQIEAAASSAAHCGVPLVHTSGAVSSSIISKSSNLYGSFYPLQTLTLSEPVDMSTVPLCVWGSTPYLTAQLSTLASRISSRVFEIDDDQRKWLHLAAVMLNNNINHLIARVQDIIKIRGLPEGILTPLLEETVRKAENYDPKEIQTGPARRKDDVTRAIHMELLKTLGDDGLTELYDYFWRSIQSYYGNELRGKG